MKKNKLNSFNQKLLVLLAIFTVSVSSVFAQKTITGVVKDSDGEPLPGVNVIIEGTTTGTITDFDGNYSIEVPSDNSVLIFSMVGMATEKVAAGSVTGEPMMLLPDLVGLDEVVVVGYGTLKKKDITGSVSSIGTDDILTSPITSLDAGLQGKMPGVTLQQSTGAPGAAMKMRIRGSSSINYSNEPLYVIDGFVGGDMTSVNPGDIERIDILKDASATAIYGSRGSNGVVLITTKTAKAGEFRISLDGTWGISQQIKDIEVLDRGTRAFLINESAKDAASIATDPNDIRNYFTDAQVDSLKALPTQNPFDYITRTAFTQNYNLSMSGGTDKITYMLSGGYINEEGIIKESFRKKYSIRSNVKADIKPWLDIKFNTYATHDNSMHTDPNHRAIYDCYYHNTIWDIYKPDGSYAMPYGPDLSKGDWEGYGDLIPDRPNPIQFNELQAFGENLNEGVTSSLDLNFKITKDLTFTTTASGRYSLTYEGKTGLPDGRNIPDENQMNAQNEYHRNRSLLTTNILKYNKTIGLHDITLTGVYEYSSQQHRRTISKVGTLASSLNKWYVLGIGQPTSTESYYWIKQIQSYMFRGNYSFADKYLLTGSLRSDKTSVFRPGNQTGIFAAFAAGWVISEENFMSSFEWLSNLKLRAGWGQTGNMAIGAYETNVSVQAPYGYGFRGYYATYGSQDGITGGLIPKNNTVNKTIKWETAEQTNIGFDISLLDGKINITTDYYFKQAKDAILQKSIPQYTGKEFITDNYGTINNKGFEFMVDWSAIEYTDLKVNVGSNLSINRNKVVDVGGDDKIFVDETDIGNRLYVWGLAANHMFVVEKGKPLGQLYGLKYKGLVQPDQVDPVKGVNEYQSFAGEPLYEDTDGSGVIDGEDRVVIGNSQADFTYGINLNVTYKIFNLAINGLGSYGNDIYNYNRHFMDANMSNPNYVNRWTPQNQGATQQRSPAGNKYNDFYLSSQYIEDGTFFKIKNVTLTCNLPKQWLDFVKINSFSIFASANNLLTFTKYSGIDPEASSTGNSSEAMSGFDAYSYPLARTYTFGFKTNF